MSQVEQFNPEKQQQEEEQVSEQWCEQHCTSFLFM